MKIIKSSGSENIHDDTECLWMKLDEFNALEE